MTLSDKGIISKIYKELTHLNSQNTNNPIKNGRMIWTDTSPKKKFRWPTGTWKDAPHRQLSGKCKLKPQWDITLHVRMANIEKNRNNKCWQGCGESSTLLHCWWECKLVQPLWKAIWRFLRKLKIETSTWPRSSTPRNLPKENNFSDSKRHMHPYVYPRTIYKSQDMEAI